MSEYNLTISGEISLEDYSDINDYIALVGENDKFTVIMGVENRQDKDIVCCMLKNNGFEIISKGEKKEKIYISAAKENKYQFKN